MLKVNFKKIISKVKFKNWFQSQNLKTNFESKI